MPKLTYKTKLLLNFTALFAVFTLLLVLFQYNREKQYKRELLEERLRCYANVVAGQTVDSLPATGHEAWQEPAELLPPELRLTIVDRRGKVLFENSGHRLEEMGNHLGRPEVQAALLRGEGSDIRLSTTEHREFFYFAKVFGPMVVRVALPYDATVQTFMKANNMFLWFVLMLFPVVLVLLIYISDRFGKAITGLKQFMRSADRGLVDYDHIEFPRSDLGDVARGIMAKYRQLEESNRTIANERERLVRHFHYFGEGIAIFSPARQCLYANARFMQYVNVVLERPTANMDALWQSDALQPAREFLQLHGGSRPMAEEAPIFRYSLRAGSSTFAVQLLVYSDGGFELTLTDITAAEKTRLLKQQMSNNITHELRTPVGSVRGYLETILNCSGLAEERKHYFLEKALAQVVRLTDLIRDVALITKTEEAAELMPRETVDIAQLGSGVQEDLHELLQQAEMRVVVKLPEEMTLYGNYSLVYAIFRNLLENSARYAGRSAEIHVVCYNATAETFYFSVYDTGRGVPEEHLPRLFERFYRVSEGRTRDGGGTGLGLSIVRNAVRFHGGDISVRNRREGGLEFLFTLSRNSERIVKP